MSWSCEVVTLNPQHGLTKRGQCPMEQIADLMGGLLGAVCTHMGEKGVEMAGPPFSIYHAVEGQFDVECGIPTKAPVDGDGEILSVTLPEGPAATTLHVGPYDQLGDAWDHLKKWVRNQEHIPGGAPWEFYLNDPGKVKDPAKFETKLFIPLRP